MLKKVTHAVLLLSALTISSITLAGCQNTPISTVSAAEPIIYVSDDALTYRWQAMSAFYEKADMLTRDDFDYEQAAEHLAQRWMAMARFYEQAGMLRNQD
ncbi:MAG: hypothetical protein AAF629_16525 [Chloroflexota bacterium]